MALVALANEAVRLRMEPITDAVLRLAAIVIDSQGLRALDAIQLATAFLVNQPVSTGYGVQFVTFDDRLLLAAEAEGLSTWKSATLQS